MVKLQLILFAAFILLYLYNIGSLKEKKNILHKGFLKNSSLKFEREFTFVGKHPKQITAMGINAFLAKQSRKPSGLFGRIFAGKLLNKANASLEDMGLKLMDAEPGSTILEIGFGNGRLISKMGKTLTNGKITGIDISREMITQAEKKNTHLIKSGKVELLEASVEEIPAGNENFDKIFTANTIYFWPDPDENIKEVKRTLKSGCKFYCALRLKDEMINNKMIGSNPRIFKNLFSENEIKAFLERSGFKDVTVYTAEAKYTNVITVGTKE